MSQFSFNLLKVLFRQYQFFPILMVQMLFPQIQQAPGPVFRMVGKKSYISLDRWIWCFEWSMFTCTLTWSRHECLWDLVNSLSPRKLDQDQDWHFFQAWSGSKLSADSTRLVPSADSLVPDQALTKCQSWSGSKLFHTLIVFLKEFFEKKLTFKKNQQMTKWKITQ